MSKYRIEILVDVDDDMLERRDGNATPPPNSVDDWEAPDLFRAAELAIVDPYESEILSCHRAGD